MQWASCPLPFHLRALCQIQSTWLSRLDKHLTPPTPSPPPLTDSITNCHHLPSLPASPSASLRPHGGVRLSGQASERHALSIVVTRKYICVILWFGIFLGYVFCWLFYNLKREIFRQMKNLKGERWRRYSQSRQAVKFRQFSEKKKRFTDIAEQEKLLRPMPRFLLLHNKRADDEEKASKNY